MELLLKGRELLDLGENLDGMTLVCQGGRCWLTQSGDSRDHILRAGERFAVRQPGRLLLTALEPSRIELLAAPCDRKLPVLIPSWGR